MISHSYITGVGAVSCLAPNWKGTWDALLSGRRASIPFSEAGFDLNLPAPVGSVEPHNRHLVGEYLCEGSTLRLAARAGLEAIQSLKPESPLALYGGSTHGESDILLSLVSSQGSGSTPDNKDALSRSLIYDSVATQFANRLGGYGSRTSWIYSSCTSSMHALLSAAMDLSDGPAESNALVVGVDALSGIGVAGFHRAGALTRSQCLPFDSRRDGTLVSEGAAAIMLASRLPDEAKSNDYVSLLGLGMSCDAGHPTQPDQQGEGLESAIRRALKGAGISPEGVAGIVLHGTGTRANDSVEAEVCRRVFGHRRVPATSIKGAIGHTLGAAGLFNCLVATQACLDGLLPRTSDASAQPLPGLDLVVGSAREIQVGGPVLVSCSGFGGNNVVAVFGKKGA